MGNAPAHELFDRISVERTVESKEKPARSFKDFAVKIHDNLPQGVKLERIVG